MAYKSGWLTPGAWVNKDEAQSAGSEAVGGLGTPTGSMPSGRRQSNTGSTGSRWSVVTDSDMAGAQALSPRTEQEISEASLEELLRFCKTKNELQVRRVAAARLFKASEDEEQRVQMVENPKLASYLRHMSEDPAVQEFAIGVLWNLSALEECRQAVVDNMIDVDLLARLTTALDAAVVARAVGTMRNLAMNEAFGKKMVEARLVQHVIALIRSCDPAIQKEATAVLWNLAVHPPIAKAIVKQHGDTIFPMLIEIGGGIKLGVDSSLRSLAKGAHEELIKSGM